MTPVRAKVVCGVRTEHPEAKLTTVRLFAVFGSAENKAFSESSPSLEMTLHIEDGKPSADVFQQGREFYLDLTPVKG